jgi:hypothetical protein
MPMKKRKRKAILGKKMPRVEEWKYTRQHETPRESEVRMDP